MEYTRWIIEDPVCNWLTQIFYVCCIQSQVAAGNLDGSLWIWDSRAHRLVVKWWGYTSGVLSTVFTPDGRGLMSGSYDNTVKYWDVSLLGNRQGVSAGTVVNDDDGFPLVRRFLGHDVSCFLPLCHNID